MDFCILYYAGYPQKRRKTGIPGKSSSGIGVFLSTVQPRNSYKNSYTTGSDTAPCCMAEARRNAVNRAFPGKRCGFLCALKHTD